MYALNRVLRSRQAKYVNMFWLSLASGSGGHYKYRMVPSSELYSRSHKLEAPSPSSLAAGCEEELNVLVFRNRLQTSPRSHAPAAFDWKQRSNSIGNAFPNSWSLLLGAARPRLSFADAFFIVTLVRRLPCSIAYLPFITFPPSAMCFIGDGAKK